jgi:uncharacterized repeat protein (TIGR01451 family)
MFAYLRVQRGNLLRKIHRLPLLLVAIFGLAAFYSSEAQAFSCPNTVRSGAPINVTYYMTASTCSTTNPGAGMILSAQIDDANSRVNFSPASVVVTNSTTTGTQCVVGGVPATGGNFTTYPYGNNTTCTVVIVLADQSRLSFVMPTDSQGYANSISSMTFTPPAGTPSWTLTATRTPATFTAAGQVINYTYRVTNTGTTTISGISIAGSKTGAITCPVSSMQVGRDFECTSSYTVQADDLGHDLAYSATATGTEPAGSTGPLAPATASGSTTFVGQPSWTLTATPTPDAFTGAGQAVAYSYTLTNTGTVAINAISVSGSKTGTISCAASSLAVAASTTCASTYTTVAGDVGTAIPYTATATGTPAAGTLANATASGSIAFTAQPALSLSVVASPTTFSNAGQVIAYAFTVTNNGNVAITSVALTDSRISGISCPAGTLASSASVACSGSLTTVVSDVLAGSISSTSSAAGVYSGNAVTSPATTTTLQLDGNAVRQATQSAIRNFMNHRAELLTSSSPDTSRMHRNLSGWLFGDGETEAKEQPSGLGGPVAEAERPRSDIADGAMMRRRPGLSGSADLDAMSGRTSRTQTTLPFGVDGSADGGGGGQFSFSASLSQMRQAALDAQGAKESSLDEPMGLGAKRRAPSAAATTPAGLDVWAEGSVAYYRSDDTGSKQDGHASLMYAGVDYQLSPAILVGMLVQLDWVSEDSDLPGGKASGRGWMAGPYASVRLSRNLYFDGRAAWGRSDNDVDPLGIYTDSFSTNRSLVSGKLTGSWSSGAWGFQPSAEIIYFEETQHSYTSQVNVFIPEQSISLGRVTFGPEVSYRFRQRDGSTFEPYVGLKGVWDFEKTEDMTSSGLIVGSDPFHGKVEIGAAYTDRSGISAGASLAYDGLGGSDLQVYQGRASVAVPLN